MNNTLEIELENREDLTTYLTNTEYEYTIIKFKAEWCKPCKKIANFVENCVKIKEEEFKNNKKKFLFITMDIDECFDLYAFLKKTKMINGIPALFLYSKNDLDEDKIYIPQYNVSGTNEEEIRKMFNKIK
tara:strand:+ start:140 stop:529 length:390 start_codon:yes stop_codon:yes gene_type:complete